MDEHNEENTSITDILRTMNTAHVARTGDILNRRKTMITSMSDIQKKVTKDTGSVKSKVAEDIAAP